MTADGRRISLYTSAPSPATARDLAEIREDLSRAAHAVVDLSEAGAAVIEELGQPRAGTTIWVDLHDYDGGSAFHEPFVRNADVVFMNADAVDDPWELARRACAAGRDWRCSIARRRRRDRGRRDGAAGSAWPLRASIGWSTRTVPATHSWPVSRTRTCEG